MKQSGGSLSVLLEPQQQQIGDDVYEVAFLADTDGCLWSLFGGWSMGADLMPFADNWAYLKTELSWLDRLLMLAIARQRKETKAINKIAQTSADQVSSHWWKGVISVSQARL